MPGERGTSIPDSRVCIHLPPNITKTIIYALKEIYTQRPVFNLLSKRMAIIFTFIEQESYKKQNWPFLHLPTEKL